MDFELDDSIREDFLVEANEIVEKLGSELVQLERQPDDHHLLNSVFRGFHTIKGGAGFLNVEPLVLVCHGAEEVFDSLRNGKLVLNNEIMDTVLQVVDIVVDILGVVSSGQVPEPAPPGLLDRLLDFVHSAESPARVPSAAIADAPGDDIADLEFDAIIDSVRAEIFVESEQSVKKTSAPDPAGAITDDEFEALLDQLQDMEQPAPVKTGTETDFAGIEAVVDQESVAVTPKQEAAARESTPAATPESTIRVSVSRLDSVMNLVGELVLVRNRLTNLGADLDNEELKKTVANLDLVTADLQNGVMQTRMQPIGKVFSRFPRLARDVARTLNKEIELSISGEDTDLDKNLVQALSDPLVHLVRNAMDHGIEAPDVRQANGKPRSGKVELSAQQEGNHIVIIIRDDGAGIDADVLRDKAVKKGLLNADVASKLSRHECYDLVFLPGFSTRDVVSDMSGRGVGMDVVKTRIAELNGNVEIDSELGKGTLVKVRVPLTLAIMPTLMVRLRQRTFAFPLSQVLEVFSLNADNVHHVAGREVIMVRGKPLPLVFLRTCLASADSEDFAGIAYVVVLQVGSGMVGFVTDDVLGQEEVVIKPLGAMLHDVPGFAGATITGDGHIALIFDVNGLMKRVSQAA
ncbi:chemotaxis protein CheA [Kineobactrum sediminis]|uniref:Chemotaxis protein CheA n=1 Tax=Kineobactrum sediminis TaxID=1905677 RepID=A0A2N5Y6G2_9GAMM|nr:chemotaxis protein CheA [Kineobactrum sediminis]PLW83959.1 chemotaxis protein CheA [Kineobactrum sediminis]